MGGGLAARHPHEPDGDGQGERALRRIGHFDRAAPHSHSREDALNALPPGAARFEHDLSGERGGIQECEPNLAAEGRGCSGAQCDDRHAGGCDHGPAAGCHQHYRNEQAELRLVGKKADQDA